MLAEVLERSRDQVVDELERRAAVMESTELAGVGRRNRLGAFVDELIGALCRGQTQEPPEPLPRSIDEPVLELRERDLVRRYLIDKIEQRDVVASPHETAVVAEWAGHADRKRLREQNRQLSALLDAVEESAVVFGPDGRVLYCNRRASQIMRETVGVTRPQIIGRTPAELGVPGELVIGRPIDEMMPLARARESFSMNAWGRFKEGQFDAVYGPDGTVGAIALVVRDVHNRRLAETRLELLTKLSGLVGTLEYDNVAEALTHVPIPELADWCAISVLENKRIRRTYLAHRDPSKAPLRDALMREIPAWDHHPLWRGLLTGGFQLLAEVNDDLLRQLAVNKTQYRLLTQMGILSLMVVPLVTRGQIAGIVTFAYTKESGRRYGRDDPPLAEELAVHAAHAFENARLMKNLTASETRFRIALAGARTVRWCPGTSWARPTNRSFRPRRPRC
jgi:PAS domain-containing protein